MDVNKYIPVITQNKLPGYFSIKCYVFCNLLEEQFPERYKEPVKNLTIMEILSLSYGRASVVRMG
jgi:hypothetical protein